MLTGIDRIKDQSGLDLFPHPTIGTDIKGNPRECFGIDDEHDLKDDDYWSFFATAQGVGGASIQDPS